MKAILQIFKASDIKPLALFFVSFFLNQSLYAVTCTSTSGGGNWSSATTWTGCTGGNGPSANTPGSADTAIISGPGTVTVDTTLSVGVLTINGGLLNQTSNLTVSNATLSGTLNIAGGTFDSNRILNVQGPMNLTAGTFNPLSNHNRNYDGLVTIDGGTWAGTTRKANFAGGLTVNTATFTSGTGLHLFDTNDQSINAAVPISFNILRVNGINLTNNTDITLSGNLSGTGTFTQGVGATLTLQSNCNVTTLNASATGNTVSFQRGGNITINDSVGGYYNLDLSPSANRTYTLAAGTFDVAGNLSIGNGSNSTTVTALSNSTTLNVSGNITINLNAELIADNSNPFTLGGDFTNSGTLTPGTGTVVLNGSTQNISGSADFNNLSITNGTNVFLSNNINIASTLLLSSGTITTDINTVQMGASGTVSRTSGHVIGSLSKPIPTGTSVSRTFEIGTGANYTPVTITFASVSSAGDLIASTTNSDHPEISTSNLDPSISVNRYWTFTNSGIGFTSYDLNLSYLSGSPADNDNPALASGYIAQRYDSATGTWSEVTLSGTPTSTSTTITGETDLGAGNSEYAIAHRLATQVVFTQEPTTATAGVAISPTITVQLQDSNGTLVTTATNTVTLAIDNNPGSPPGTLSGTLSVAAVGGIATFSDISIDKAGTGYTLNASSTGLTGNTSASFDINAGSASQLSYEQQPTSQTPGDSIDPALIVRIEDSYGNLVTSATNTVNIAIQNNPSAGTLSGTTSIAAIAGLATFSDLSIDNSGTGYTLNATSTGLTNIVSSSFDVTTNSLVITQEPSNSVAGTNISPAITVEVRNALDVLITSSTKVITLSILDNAGSPPGTLSGTLSVAAVGGIATFSNISIDKAGTGYTLIATGSNAASDTSATFDISPAAASKLHYAQEPTNTDSQITIAPSISVEILDAYDNLVSSATNSITLAIGTNPNSGTLSGTTSIAAVGGIANFTDISIEKAGSGYTLDASASGLTGASSGLFDINPGAATQLIFSQEPSQANSGIVITPDISIEIQDAAGNLVTSATDNINISINSNPSGGTLSGTASINATGGIAVFNDLSIDNSGVGYTLDASASGLSTATSVAFDVLPVCISKTGNKNWSRRQT
ncbi:MAG: hypothetical protein R3A80_03225 [Bdellovibrionota bacterium]